MAFVIAIAVFGLSAVICHNIAKARGANPVFWGVMGVVFGPLAIAFSYFAGSNKD